MAEPADVSIIVRDGSPEPVCTVQVALKIWWAGLSGWSFERPPRSRTLM